MHRLIHRLLPMAAALLALLAASAAQASESPRVTSAGPRRLAAGSSHTCEIRPDQSVTCWGKNDSGQTIAPAGAFVQIGAGYKHTCGVKTDGSVECWGSNSRGQSAPPPGTFSQVSAGYEHTCGVKSDGNVACWGSNDDMQGDAPSGTFTQVSAGKAFTCGIKSNGSIACWGNTADGKTTPPAGTFTQISAGSSFTCGVKTDGSLACWGLNSFGEATPPSGTFVQVSAGLYHTCGVKSDNSVACWGDGSSGQLAVPAGAFVQVSVGLYHTCGVKSDNSLVCWGSNTYGQAPRLLPTALPAGLYKTPYSQSLAAPYTPPAPNYALVAGSLPSGLALSAAGVLGGTPTSVGTSTGITIHAQDANGFVAQQTYSLTIDKAPLVVTADSKSRVYGTPNPALTYQASGFVGGETAAAVLSGAITTAASTSSDVGTYPITQGTLAAQNYMISFTPGTLTIAKAPLTITAADALKHIGTANPKFRVSYSGFVLGEGPSVLGGTLAFSTTATTDSPVGVYPITPAGLTSANYAITFIAGSLTVTDKFLPVISWPAPPALTYGTPSGAAQLKATADVTGTFSYAPPAGTLLNAGVGQTLQVTFTPADATYLVVTATVAIDVAKAPLLIRADDKTRLVGTDNPPLTASYSGFVNGEGPSVLSTPVRLTTTADAASPTGSYPILASDAAAANYAISFANGILTVTPPAVSPPRFSIYVPLVARPG